MTVDIGECVKLEASDERLACYGRHVDAVVKQNDAAPPRLRRFCPPYLPWLGFRVGARRTSVVGNCGHAAAAIARHTSRSPSRQTDPSVDSSSITATVTALKETVPNVYLITLDNGQVWRQNSSQRYPLQPGQRVTLSRTQWGGAYRLNAEGLHGFIQVERVR